MDYLLEYFQKTLGVSQILWPNHSLDRTNGHSINQFNSTPLLNQAEAPVSSLPVTSFTDQFAKVQILVLQPILIPAFAPIPSSTQTVAPKQKTNLQELFDKMIQALNNEFQKELGANFATVKVMTDVTFKETTNTVDHQNLFLEILTASQVLVFSEKTCAAIKEKLPDTIISVLPALENIATDMSSKKAAWEVMKTMVQKLKPN